VPRLAPWTPDLISLDLLLSVVELGSVGKAATAHGMTQPSASARLRRLERQLGVPVLVRSAQGSTLTPAGEAVVVWAAAVVDGAHALVDGVQTLREGVGARLRVAASLTVAEYLMTPWLLGLRRAHPDVEVTATVSNSRTVCDVVRAGGADLGFIEAPQVPAGFSHARVGNDRLALVASPDLVDGLGTDEIDAERLTELPLLLREHGSGTRDTFLRAWADALGREPELVHAVELGSTTTILATARAGGGIGVVSSRAVSGELASHALSVLHVHGLQATRPLTAVWLGRQPTELARELVELAGARRRSRSGRKP
jgi:DNA-binding transcriptional LysR family regulator